MPVSRKRKRIRKGRGRNKQSLVAIEAPFELAESGVFRIKKQVFDKFWDNDDFVAMIRVARLTNALNYMGDCIAENPGPPETPPQFRTTFRNLYNTGGYVHEGLLLVEHLRDNGHSSHRYFGGFKRILDDPKYAEKREMTRVIRNSAAFHLDHHDRSTRKGLEIIRDLHQYDFVSGEDDSLGALYFNIADLVDVNLIIHELKGERTDEKEALREIANSVTNLLGDMARASEKFVLGISKKMKLMR